MCVVPTVHLATQINATTFYFTGRILNRFSTDTEFLDSALPADMQFFYVVGIYELIMHTYRRLE